MFDKHLKNHGIGYFAHMRLAFFIAGQSLQTACMAFFHGCIPFLYETDASEKHAAMMPEYKKRLEKAQEAMKN